MASMQGPAWLPEKPSVETLIDAYGDDILRLCLLYMGERQLAEDAFQETMVKAWRALPSFRGESGYKTWIAHIAVNTCRDMLRKGWFRMLRRSRPLEALLELPVPTRDESSDVTQAVLSLPGKYREVIVLTYYQDMKLREVAQALEIPVNTVSTRLRRARALLKKALQGSEDA